MKTIVVTGCAGLIGAHTSRHLLKQGYRVIGVDDLSGGYKDYLPDHENFEFWSFDLSGRHWGSQRLEDIFSRESPVACYHFAAYAAEGLSPFIRHFNYNNNVLASMNIINACINHDCKLIFTSSMAVYGNQVPPFQEDMQPAPIDPYGVAKFAVEMDIEIADWQHNLRYNIIRPHNVVGIYQNIWDRYRNVAGIFIKKALDGEPLLIYGDGEQTRAFSDIQYYMEPFELLIDQHDNEVFNIGADKHYSINDLANIVTNVAQEHGFACEKQNVEARHEVKHAYCNHQKAREQLGFKDDTDIEELISNMFVWAMNQPKREQKNMKYETEKGMYDCWK